MSDTNRIGQAYVIESTYGVTPSGPPTLKNLRWTKESLKLVTPTKISNEVRSDRNIVDKIRTGLSTAGDLEGELSYGAYDDLYELAFQNNATWPSALDVVHNSGTDNIVVAASGSNFTLTLTTTNWVTLGFSLTADVGKIVKLGSTANPWTAAGNNGYATIVSVGGSGNKVLTLSGLAMIAGTQSTGSVAIRRCSFIATGTTLQSMSLERSYGDVASTFMVYNGLCVDTWDLNVGLSDILTTKFGLIGKNETAGTATVGSGTNTAAPTADVMNSIDHITGVIEGGTAVPITNFKSTLKNNLRARLQVGTQGPVSIGAGAIEFSGSFEAYFNAAMKTQLAKYRAGTATSFGVNFVDSAGNGMVLSLPRVKFDDAGASGEGGINTDVFAKFTFSAILDPTQLITARLSRSAAN